MVLNVLADYSPLRKFIAAEKQSWCNIFKDVPIFKFKLIFAFKLVYPELNSYSFPTNWCFLLYLLPLLKAEASFLSLRLETLVIFSSSYLDGTLIDLIMCSLSILSLPFPFLTYPFSCKLHSCYNNLVTLYTWVKHSSLC